MSDFAAALDAVLPLNETVAPTPANDVIATEVSGSATADLAAGPAPYLAALDAVLPLYDEKKEKNRQVRTNILQAADGNPDQAAKAYGLGLKTGLAPDVVERNYPQVQAEAKVEQYGSEALLGQKLHDWLLNPTNAKIAIDDIEALQGVERSAKKVGGFLFDDQLEADQYLAGGVRRGFEGMAQGFNTVGRANALKQLALFDSIDRGDNVAPANDPLGYGDMTPGQREVERTRVRAQIFNQTMGLQRSRAYTAGLPQDPAVQPFMAALQQITLSPDFFSQARTAVDKFLDAPLGIPLQLSADSAAYMLPTIAGAVVGGPVGSFLGALLPDYATRFDDILAERMQQIVSSDDQFMAGGFDPKSEVEVLRFMMQRPDLVEKMQGQAFLGAHVTALGDAATIGMARPVSATATLKQNARALGINLGREVVMEGVQEAGARAVAGQDWDTAEVVSEMLGAGPMAVAGTAKASVSEFRAGLRQDAQLKALKESGDNAVEATKFMTDLIAHVAEQDGLSLDDLIGKVQQSKLTERSPAKMADFLGSILPDKNVYVPAEAVREYFQKIDPAAAQTQALALGIEGQLAEALSTGGDVVIPLNQFVVHASEDMVKDLRKAIRQRPSAMSISEAEEYGKDAGARAKAVAEKVGEQLDEITKINKARDAVVAQVERELQLAGESPEAARQLAPLFGERYVTRAARLGRGDASSAYAASGVEFRSDLPAVIKQAPADDLELLIRALKGKTDRSEAGGTGPTILQAISRGGGIIDDAGELQARDVDKWHQGKAFQRKAIREVPQEAGGGIPGLAAGEGDRSRYGMDAWALRLWEDGYFPEFEERPSIDDLLAAIDEEMRGKPRRVEKAGKGWVADFDMAVRDLDELLTRAGVDSRKASVEEIRAALAEMNKKADGQTFEQQVETDAFKKWFGDSKVVDEDGKPLVVYHGSTKSMDEFKVPAFFTPDAKETEFYSLDRSGEAGGQTYPVYLSIQNPFDIRDQEGSFEFAELVKRAGVEITMEGGQHGWSFEAPAIRDHSPYDGTNFNDLIYIPAVREQMKKEGYDGLQAWDAMSNYEIPVWVVLDAGQIKSATGNRGTFDPNSARIYEQGAMAPPFYSGVGRAIEQSKLKKGTAEQWMGTLRNAPGVKAEELKWLGLEDWLKAQDGAVTKEAVLGFVQANQIQVEEVTKGGANISDETVAAIREWVDAESDRDPSAGRFSEDDWASLRRGDSEMIGMLEGFGVPGDLMAPLYAAGPTKFGSDTLPGGENYREVLLTLPPKDDDNALKALSDAHRARADAVATYKQLIEELGQGDERTQAARDEWMLAARAADEAQEAVNNLGKPYQSSHWDEANVLAHVRLNDRVIDGKRTLFVEEVQSDFGQDLRKQRKIMKAAIEADFQGIVERMKKAGVLEEVCD